MIDKTNRIVISIIGFLLLLITSFASAVLPTSKMKISSFTGSYNFGIAEPEGIWRNLEFRVKFIVEGKTSIDTFCTEFLENHIFFHNGSSNSYYPMHASNIVFTNRDSIRTFYNNYSVSDSAYYYLNCDVTFNAAIPDSGITTVYFFFDGNHWILNDSLKANWAREYLTLLTPIGSLDKPPGSANLVDPYSRNLINDYYAVPVSARASFYVTGNFPTSPAVKLNFTGFTDDSWVPVPDDSIGLIFTLDVPLMEDTLIYFISQISQYEGTCMNGPPVAADFRDRKTEAGQFFDYEVINPFVLIDYKYDISIYDTTGIGVESSGLVETDIHTIVAKTKSEVNCDTIYLKCKDYGAHAVVTAGIVGETGGPPIYPMEVIIQGLDSDTVRYVAVPKDEDCRVQIQPLQLSTYRTDVGDGMADVWEDSICDWYYQTTDDTLDIHCLTPYWLYSDSNESWNCIADSDFVVVGDSTLGDGLTVLEEYRGFMIERMMSGTIDTMLFRRHHVRTNPFIKDLFVSFAPMNRFTIGFADTLPIPVHMIDYSRSTKQLSKTQGYNPDLGGVAPVVNSHHVTAKIPFHRWIRPSNYTTGYKKTFAPVLQSFNGERTWKIGDRRDYIEWPFGNSNFCTGNCGSAYLATQSGMNYVDLWQQTGIFISQIESDLDLILYEQVLTIAEIDSIKHAAVKKVIGHEIGHAAGIPPLEEFPTEFSYSLAKDSISIMFWGFSMMDSLGNGIPRTYDSQDTSYIRLKLP